MGEATGEAGARIASAPRAGATGGFAGVETEETLRAGNAMHVPNHALRSTSCLGRAAAEDADIREPLRSS